MMASKSMKVLNIIAGVLLIVAGIYCLCNQDIAAMTAGVMVGIFMLLSGVIEIVVFATTSGLLFGSGWLLLDGVLTVILSLFLLFNAQTGCGLIRYGGSIVPFVNRMPKGKLYNLNTTKPSDRKEMIHSKQQMG